MPELTLYDSLSRKKQVFAPIDTAHARIYACGPTVYNYAHIGNARMAVAFDLLARLLRTIYPKVTYVSNITDVDDKIIRAAEESGEDIGAITRKYARIYNEDMAALGVAAPDIQPLATETIPEMIALIQKLIDEGHAYANEGHVMFNVPSYDQYGALSGRSRDEQIAGSRVEVAPYKKDPADFVLWKPSSDDQPGWDSPWGRGRPGWHIECSAMAEKHLGLPFDIHGGGADLKFPHHENEIAQSCCAHNTEHDATSYARYWMHNGFVTVEGEKMSKSIGNIILAHDLVQSMPGEAIRYALMNGHYRQPLDWTETGLYQAKKTLDRMYQHLRELKETPVPAEPKVAAPVLAAMCDDLNTPKALAALSALTKSAGEAESMDEQSRIKGEILASAELLGLLQSDPDAWLGYDHDAETNDDATRIDALLEERQQARKNKDFARADEIRDQLAAEGVTIEDTPQGAVWRKK